MSAEPKCARCGAWGYMASPRQVSITQGQSALLWTAILCEKCAGHVHDAAIAIVANKGPELRAERVVTRRVTDFGQDDAAQAPRDPSSRLKKIPLPPLDKGWYWFAFDYRAGDGAVFDINFAAQSMEDAETRLRLIRETAHFCGQVVAEYEASDEELARARTVQRGTVPGTSLVCKSCGCRWKQHADRTLQLYDASQKPCALCDNGPNPPLRHETPDDFDAQEPCDAPAHRWAAWRRAGHAADAESTEWVIYCVVCGDEHDEEIHGEIKWPGPEAPASPETQEDARG